MTNVLSAERMSEGYPGTRSIDEEDMDPEDSNGIFEESIMIMERVIERKTQEIERYRSMEGMEKLVEYLENDIKSYKAVLSDMGKKEYCYSADNDDPLGRDLWVSGQFREYMDSLQGEDLEDELAADGFRCDYYEDVMDAISFEVGVTVLTNRKMIKALRNNEYALMAIGDLIMRDETLLELFDEMTSKSSKNPLIKKKTK